MDCSQNEFVSFIEPWYGKMCLVVVVSDRVNVQAWMRLESFCAADSKLKLSGRICDLLSFISKEQNHLSSGVEPRWLLTLLRKEFESSLIPEKGTARCRSFPGYFR